MHTFPRDQFDDVPDDLYRVGAHRAAPRPGHRWIAFAWAALATGLLVALGVYWLAVVSDRVSIDIPVFQGAATETPTATPTAEPVTDPSAIDPAREISVTVLNGTPTAELQKSVGDTLTEAGWPIGAVAAASARDIESTLVYYSDPANEDIARGLVLALGVGDVRLSDAFLGAPVTVVLGADYPPQ